eukprot:Nitzschia sp. Nitz4//scaffold139_size61406//49965//50339//NITZ4_006466-RA/size61406-processed-gene-0.86-mRNA-1//-1//CDS//3329535870//6484//frame0
MQRNNPISLYESATGLYVYVLTIKRIYHTGVPAEQAIVGVYISKESAVHDANNMSFSWGDFDDLIEDCFEEAYVDNRNNPPDNGILMQLGNNDHGQGNSETLFIEKCQLLGLPLPLQSKKRKSR